MSTSTRNPLSSRSLTNHTSVSTSSIQSALRKSSSAKRARSPDPGEGLVVKRSKALIESSRQAVAARDEIRRKEYKEPKEERDRRRIEREEEFRIKYTRAFPNWVFYFDLDADAPETAAVRKEMEKMVHTMGSRTEDFFSKDVTHVIVTTFDDGPVNKENHKSRGGQRNAASLLSPIKLKKSAADSQVSELVKKALSFDMKVWSADKLRSVLERCLPLPSGPSGLNSTSVRGLSQPAKERSLTRLLENERIHGTTERDPTQKRHDFVYFSKNSYFVLVEDMRQELQTLIALEYPISKSRDGKERGSWPVLHCHPLARGPFVEYDEKENRRRERAERAEQEREEDLARRKAKLREQEKRRRAQEEAQKKGDLRRTVSMQNMRRRASMGETALEGLIDLDDDFEGDPDSAAASGYLASGNYVAASGNSVGITSTTGTTSTAGLSLRTLQLPRNIAGKLNRQVVTSRRLSHVAPTIGKENSMGPPTTIPDRPQRLLRKSRSTNTMRLPKRDEGSKPGYCESCRLKFEDFKEHIYSKKHRKFAQDDANFANLDHVLSRVKRRTQEEVRAEREGWELQSEQHSDGEADEDEDLIMDAHEDSSDDVKWQEWLDVSAVP
ncbi:hypothetical protein BDW22DRAFT_1484911 [Trametopsis cervina]|nr:hypothetical protein BDW22DRAFT_1484911 [Trametopsis cervina]